MKIQDRVGIEAGDDQLNRVISELNGKDVENTMAQSVGQLTSVPSEFLCVSL